MTTSKQNTPLNSGNTSAASKQDENIYPKPIAAHGNCTRTPRGTTRSPQWPPAAFRRLAGAIPASLAASGRFSVDPCHCSSTTILALSSWSWEHSPPVWAASWGTLGLSRCLTSHPVQMQHPAPRQATASTQHLHAAVLQGTFAFNLLAWLGFKAIRHF